MTVHYLGAVGLVDELQLKYYWDDETKVLYEEGMGRKTEIPFPYLFEGYLRGLQAFFMRDIEGGESLSRVKQITSVLEKLAEHHLTLATWRRAQ